MTAGRGRPARTSRTVQHRRQHPPSGVVTVPVPRPRDLPSPPPPRRTLSGLPPGPAPPAGCPRAQADARLPLRNASRQAAGTRGGVSERGRGRAPRSISTSTLAAGRTRRRADQPPGAAHLGSHEVRRVAGRHEQPVLGAQLLGKPEVTDADGLGVPGLVHVQNVARLQVPVHDLGGRRTRLTRGRGGAGTRRGACGAWGVRESCSEQVPRQEGSGWPGRQAEGGLPRPPHTDVRARTPDGG